MLDNKPRNNKYIIFSNYLWSEIIGIYILYAKRLLSQSLPMKAMAEMTSEHYTKGETGAAVQN